MLDQATLDAIVTAIWTHPQGQAFLGKVSTIRNCVIAKGNPCCNRYSQGKAPKPIGFQFTYDAEANIKHFQRAKTESVVLSPSASASIDIREIVAYFEYAAIHACAAASHPVYEISVDTENDILVPTAAARAAIEQTYLFTEMGSTVPAGAAVGVVYEDATVATSASVEPKGIKNPTEEQLIAMILARRKK